MAKLGYLLVADAGFRFGVRKQKACAAPSTLFPTARPGLLRDILTPPCNQVLLLADHLIDGLPHLPPLGYALAGNAELLEGRRTFGARSLGTGVAPASLRCRHLTPLLSGVNFIGHARFGAGEAV